MTSSGGTGSAPETAAIPERYRAGCDQFTPALAEGADRRINAGRLAVAFGRCGRLQADTVTWTECHLLELAGKPLPPACKILAPEGRQQ